MSKQAGTFSLMLAPRPRGTPSGQWILAALRDEILEGRLRPGTRLPATRELAGQYGLSRGTIVGAFEQLKAEGYLEGLVGSGSYVSQVLPDDLFRPARTKMAQQPAQTKPRRRFSNYAARVTLLPGCGSRRVRAFRANQPALDLFPTTLWAKIAARRARLASATHLLGCDAMGYEPLQKAIADYLTTSRGVKCDPKQIVIVCGIQEALDLTARLFLNPGDRVALENPGYPGAACTFEALGAKIVALPLDDEGIRLQPGKLQGVRLVYITPAHQFPLGITMSLRRRLDLLEWARKAGAIILEDDYDSEYRYSGRPLPALQGLDQHGVVLFAGSFSKVMFPALRLGYLVIPPDLVDRFAAARSITTRHAPHLEQAVLCDFITEGHFGRHIRRMREVYAGRLSVLLESAREALTGLLEIPRIEAGLQTAGWLCDGIDGESAAQTAAKRDVEVTPLSPYYWGRAAREGLHLGFASVDQKEIRRGVRQLAAALESELRKVSKV